MEDLKGKAFVFGDNINTDLIVPGQYMHLSDPLELARCCMEGVEENFASKIEKGDIFVGGSNFGCGSSREHAPISMKFAGVSCVIAKSYARIFFRNAINIGLPAIVSVAAAEAINEGDELKVDLGTGTITNLTSGDSYKITPFPPFMLDILNAGGVINYINNKKRS